MRGGWWAMWCNWCSEHPATILYIAAVTSLNFLLNVIEVLH